MNFKIRPQHLQRLAIVYVRQSSPTQVREHRESPRRQQALKARAEELGWPSDRVLVLQEEKARSGSTTHGRDAYRQLTEAVFQGRAGIIFAVEVSRWGRDTAAWQLLLRDCIFADILLADEQHLYDPNDPHDHVMLGIQGALAEYELRLIRERMLTCWWNKAERAELFTHIPPGYTLTRGQGLQKHPHRRIQDVVALVFEKFQQLPSVNALHRWFLEHQQLLPQVAHRDDPLNVQWRPATYRRLHWMLKNPAYTGAYVMGRSESVVERTDAGELIRRRRLVPPEQWEVLEKDCFPAYTSWQQYEANVAKIERNGTVQGNVSQPAPQRGVSLLSGLLRCRRCGHKLSVRYGRSGQCVYHCVGGKTQRSRGPLCLSFSGRHVEAIVSQAVLEAAQPAGVEAARCALELWRHDSQHERQALLDQLEQLRYEADRTQRQYDRVEPENRLVAAELESRWNAALRAVAGHEARVEAFEREQGVVPQPAQAEQLLALGQHLERVWYSEQENTLRKQQIVRLLVREVWADVDESQDQVVLTMHWTGGHHTSFQAPRRSRRGHTTQVVKTVVTALRAVCDDAGIAHALNRNAVRHKSGSWTAARVSDYREQQGLAAFDPSAKQAAGLLLQEEAARELAISPMSVHRLIQAGILAAEQPGQGFPCIIRRSDLNLPAVQQAVHRIQANLPRPLPEDPNQLKLF